MPEGLMHYWERFTSFKQRGEWVERQFMAAAAKRRFSVSKPWGETRAYDVGIERGENFRRVLVKSTIVRSGAGYRCQFMPNHQKKHDYSSFAQEQHRRDQIPGVLGNQVAGEHVDLIERVRRRYERA